MLVRHSSLGRRRKHVAVAWVAPAELRAYDLAAADWPVVAMLTTNYA